MVRFSLLRFAAPALLGGLALLGGCCANNICDCPGEAKGDAVPLTFSADTATTASPGFRAADLDTLVLRRYPLPYKTTSKFDEVLLYRRGARVRDTLVLNNNTPFAQSGNLKLSGYAYELLYLAHPANVRKGVATRVVLIERIALKGALEGDGCCTCHTNTGKYVTVAGRPDSLNLTGAQAPSIILTKP